MSPKLTASKLSKQAREGLFWQVLEANDPLTAAEADAFAKIDQRRARALAEQPSDDRFELQASDRLAHGKATTPRAGWPEACEAKASASPSAAVPRVTCETAVASVLEQEQKTVEQAERPGSHLLKRTRCRCRFCDICCKSEGLKTRDKLLPILRTFEGGITMITFTIDPTLCEPARQWFMENLDSINHRRKRNVQKAYTLEQIQGWCGQEVIYRYIQERRCIGEWVRSMFKAGHLSSRRYVCAIEYQMGKDGPGTLMPHYHLVVEARHFSEEAEAYAKQRWSDFRPPAAGPVLERRPGFGILVPTFSKVGDGQAPERAAAYLLKYIGKSPEKGWPQWVMQSHGEVKRIWTSKGFYGPPDSAEAAETVGDDQPMCEVDAAQRQQEIENIARVNTTNAERVAQCGKGTLILKRPEVVEVESEKIVNGETVKVVERFVNGEFVPFEKCEFVERLPDVPLERVLHLLNIELPPNADSVRITWQEARRVQEAFGKQRHSVEPMETAFVPGPIHQRPWAARRAGSTRKPGRAA